jgi:hypothetical protein
VTCGGVWGTCAALPWWAAVGSELTGRCDHLDVCVGSAELAVSCHGQGAREKREPTVPQPVLFFAGERSGREESRIEGPHSVDIDGPDVSSELI